MFVPTLKVAIENAEPDEDFEYLPEEEKNSISIITQVSCGIGFTSLCFVGRCQFDGNQHDDKDMVYERMIGLRKMYPYNGIQYSCEKKWMFECVCLYKYLELGTFPIGYKPEVTCSGVGNSVGGLNIIFSCRIYTPGVVIRNVPS